MELHQTFSQSLQSAADTVWARFCETMPRRYFQETSLETQLAHLHVLTACQASGVDQDMVVRSHNGDTWTFLTGRSFPGQLGEMLDRLPADRNLLSARAYTSSDGQWVLDIFELGEQSQTRLSPEEMAELETRLNPTKAPDYSAHLQGCAPDYLRAVSPKLAQVHFQMMQEVRRSGDVVVQWESLNEGVNTLRLATESSQGRLYFQRVARYLGRQGIDIERAYVTSFHDARYLGFNVRGLHPHSKEAISHDLKRLFYLDESVLNLAAQLPAWDLLKCEIADFLISLSHLLLCHDDPVRFTRERLVQSALRGQAQLSQLVQSIAQNQPPPDTAAHDREEDRIFFETCRNILSSLDRHNLNQPDRRASGARLQPQLFEKIGNEKPYAVFFVRGRGYEGFHVRFQDVARGGMRLVCPRSLEAHSAESERLFDEAYSLARAQHLKNKDIPEGGAKAVVLVVPGGDAYFAGQTFANTLLDLTLGTPELIYLGPDENVSIPLIEWITRRAAFRGHPLPQAFMSSKPGAGINHKEFGITSEGVTVFLEESLRQLGIDPASQPFTVKITGGPDGDVAGNEINILLTRYPNTARIVGVADGSGVAEDPAGLDADELLRLFREVLPIAHFQRQKLSPRGQLVSIEETGGVELRNSMHYRLPSDAFVPAGGRPATLNGSNWRQFLSPEGRPSSRLIVEGANLFLTEEARRHLSAAGVAIIKDSSANKCGVICSSFEVLASMLLSEAEFLEHKTEFVTQVIERLRSLARCEAQLLYREHNRRPDLCLPTLSVRLSQVMLRTAEAVAEASLDPLTDLQGGTQEVLQAYLPPVLLRLAGDRLGQVPRDYRQRIVACSLAGKIVYREGIAYLEDLPQPALRELALTYLRGERIVRGLISEVLASNLNSSDKLAEILELGGARTLAQNPRF
jgi:glutamate dehydrogenase